MHKHVTAIVFGLVSVFLTTLAIATEPLQLDEPRLNALEIGERILIEHVSLGQTGLFTLDVERFRVDTPETKIVEGTADGDRNLPPRDLVLLKGTVVGDDEDSLVFLSVGAYGVHGFISRHDALWSISSGPYVGLLGPHQQVLVTSAEEFQDIRPGVCLVDANDPWFYPPAEEVNPIGPTGLTTDRGGSACELAPIAIDSDYEFTANLFGGNVSAAADYAVTLLAGVSTIYERDVRVALSLGYLRVWGENVDPYGSPNEDLGRFLEKVRNHWRSTMSGQERVVVQGLSGRNLGGGLAWVNTICSNDWGYGVSANLGGSFPMPIEDHRGGNWDLMVVAHEMGHNFGTGHTHDSYDPTIDDCGNGDCSNAWGGTIMSYCHTCPGGLANMVMSFHPRVQEVIEATVAGRDCFTLLPDGVSAIDDRADTVVNALVTIDVLANDVDQSCGVPSITTIDDFSVAGGTIEVIASEPLNRVRYTPPTGFVGEDTFSYAVDDTVSATVTVVVHAFRPADQPSDPQLGVQAAYYWLPSAVMLPDFDSMTPYYEFVIPEVHFPATLGQFGTSGLENNLGAVFEGFIQIPFPGLYTLEIESDEGSRLYLGDSLLIENDGIHRMTTQSAVAALYPGLHRVKIEYFEATGYAGLIVRLGTSGTTPTVIPASSWFHSEAPLCPVDLTGDDQVDFFDVQAFLNAYAMQSSVADWNNDGVYNFFDVQAYLGAFAVGCP